MSLVAASLQKKESPPAQRFCRTTGAAPVGAVSNLRVSEIANLFFFSSRRRHTSFDCDWSSDVCSSDLWVPAPPPAPGVVYVRPVYAPALVAWVGGPHFSIGVGIGGASAVGWFPLGPREVYVPTYPVSRTYVSNVNVSNTTVNNTVVNNYYNNVVVNKNTTVINQTTYVNQ